ncbi:MAG: precorrin-6y C5,15-methyltransferase (decarboxylating) subunit CbiE [Streptosporangiales bacterium]|nr:precorrin-6y C5,15-methyltransferase (decarboxylating) subunit CbiE [Streptosporangiales bacterium]
MSITVIGYDGSPLAPEARRALASATLVAGGARHLAAVEAPEEARRAPMGDVAAAIDAVAGHDGDSVVLASGDPGFFGIVRGLRERGLTPAVLPARSSVALAFARLGLPWDDAVVVSAHGRDLRRAVNVCRAHPKVAVFTGPGGGPAELARALEDVPRTFVVAENLGGDERVTRCDHARARAEGWRDPNVVLVLDESRPVNPATWVAGRQPGPATWALPEHAFAHRDSVITKAEVRALVLARLGPRLGDLVWDVGAGSGSVAVECARFGAAAVAVERDAEACARIGRNAEAHDVEVGVVHGEAPSALATLPDPDAVFVGGGGPRVVEACAARDPRAVVVGLAAVERVGATREALEGCGYRVDGIQLQASRLAPLPDGTHRLAPVNPVFVLCGSRP